MDNLIKKNPKFLKKLVKEYLEQFYKAYEFQKLITNNSALVSTSSNILELEWLIFEKSLISSNISNLINQDTLIKLQNPENQKCQNFLKINLIKPITTKIIHDLKNPLSIKKIESYIIPNNLKKYKVLDKNDQVAEAFLIEMGVIQTEDEKFNSREFNNQFINSIVFENFYKYEENYSNNKIKTIFKVKYIKIINNR